MQRAAQARRVATREQDWLNALRRGLVERLLGRLPAVPCPGNDWGGSPGRPPAGRAGDVPPTCR